MPKNGEGNVNPLQYSCLENSMGRRAWWATVHRVAESQTQLSTYISPLYVKEDSKIVAKYDYRSDFERFGKYILCQ